MIVIDMDNPTDCDFCPFACWSFYNTGLIGCNAKGQRSFTIKERTEDGKPDWCPIIGEIPGTTSWLKRLVRPKMEVDNADSN